MLIQATEFELQGRAQRAVVDGSPSDATIFVSLAAEQFTPASDTVEARVNSTGDGVGTYIITVHVAYVWATLSS